MATSTLRSEETSLAMKPNSSLSSSWKRGKMRTDRLVQTIPVPCLHVADEPAGEPVPASTMTPSMRMSATSRHSPPRKTCVRRLVVA